MKLGKIQKIIIQYLKQGPETGCYIGSTTRYPGFRGLDLEQVQSALEGLVRRGIVRKEGPLPRCILVHK